MNFTRTAPRRHALVASIAALTASAVLPTAASAQTSPPPPTPIGDFCAEAPTEDAFGDVGDDDPWAAAVRCLTHAGITAGVAPDAYLPANAVTRQQMASFVARMMDTAVLLDGDDTLTALPAAADGREVFNDLSRSPHTAAIGRLHAAGIVQGGPGGRPADTYGPSLPVSRGQMAAFLTGAVEHLTGTPLAADGNRFDDDDDSVHEDAIDALAANGIAVGYGNRTYRPQAPVQRASMASFLVRPLANLQAAGAIDALPAHPEVDAPLAVADSLGVRVLDADGSTRHAITTVHASNAFAIGTDLVVYEGMDGNTRVWRHEQGEEIVELSGMGNTLFDARLVDGTPTALTVELANGRAEAVLVDLVDDSRTTVDVIEDIYNDYFISGRILPDGDVVMVTFSYSADSSDNSWLMERRTPGAADPVWSTTSDGHAESEKQLLLQDGTLYSVEATAADGARPSLSIIEHDADTGAAVSTRTVDVATFAGSNWNQCPDLVSADVIICNPDDHAPVAVDLTTGWVRTLPARDDATVTEMRAGAAG